MQVSIPGPAGRLVGVVERPAGTLRGGAVVCHPHPLHGGSLRSAIVVRTARALRASGLATLRLNFRGVEGSEGVHDGGGAEEDDVAAALDWLAGELGPAERGGPLWAAGFSFGARTVSALAPRDPRIRRLILIALPLRAFDCPWLERVQQPTYMLFGGADEFGTLSDLRERHPDLPSNFQAEEIPGADHLFRGRTPLLEEHVRAYAQRAIEQPT